MRHGILVTAILGYEHPIRGRDLRASMPPVRWSAVAPSRPLRLRTSAVAMLVAVAAFVALFVLAVRAYPGGTAWDPAARGHHFWLNYLCDLTRGVALNGEPNPVGSILGQAGMVALALGLLPLWWLLPHLFPSRARLGIAVRVLGSLTSPGAIAVTLMPSDRFGAWHSVAIMLAGPPGLLAALLAVAGLVREERGLRVAAAIGAAMLLTAAIDFFLYLSYLSGTGPMVVAVLERGALILLLAWMVTVSLRAGSGR